MLQVYDGEGIVVPSIDRFIYFYFIFRFLTD